MMVGRRQECFPGRGIAAQQDLCGSLHYRDAETTVTVNCNGALYELHLTSTSKFVRRSFQ
jgi:hypothetical protein